MKTKIIGIFFLLCIAVASAQTTVVGSKFDFNQKAESNPQIVLADNYNHYMMSVITVTGIQAKNSIVIRKFDQTNQLVDTFTKDFSIDMFTLHNYRGGFELSNNKVVVFIESSSNKRKISELYQYTFDKTANTFDSKVIASYPIESFSKSGSFSVSKSQNGMYFGVVYQKHNSKKEPEESDCFLLDAKSVSQIWKKSVTFTDEYYSTEKIVTNSGKIIVVRDPRSYKDTPYLVVVSQENQENKTFEEDTRIQKPVAFSIGNQDYVLCFNYKRKGVRGGDFGNIMVYDLTQGKVLKNNQIGDFNQTAKIKDVYIRKVFMENNEIRVFVEGSYQSGTKPSTTFPNSTFQDPKYNFGPAHLLVFSFEGDLKQNIKLENNPDAEPDLFQSFDVLNIKGNYIVHTGIAVKNNNYYYGFYKLNPNNKFEKTNISVDYSERGLYGYKNVNQLIYYFNDTNNFLVARLYNDGQMALVTFPLN
jgi:hypothetical protein